MWLGVAASALIAAAAIAAWIVTAPRLLEEETAREVSAPGDPAAGRTVFFIAGCESCHMSPRQDDPLRLGGGMELKTPFGSFYPPNISPDLDDGIGAWTEIDIATAIMAGVSRNGGHLYPALPYASYCRMSIKDVRDLIAFLRTTAPVKGKAPPNALSFPFSIRRAVGFWKLLYMPRIEHPVATDPAGPNELGRYLVQGPGHCPECHSPRTFLGGIVESRRLTGGPLPEGKGKAPNITAVGLKDWSESDIADALSTGLTPGGDTLGGPMAAVVRSLSQAPAADLAAIAGYLKSYRAGAAP
ncbi:MAG: cytochrome c [Hyphomicrobiales bacterium]|nr:cytochrome c [Hyphomicrobiales bacterium]